MIWLWVVALAAATVAPLLISMLRTGQARGRQEAAMALHKAQLQELDRELEDGRLVAVEHEAAKLEVQRRLLADAALAEPAAPRRSLGAVAASVILVPAAALGLYIWVGQPGFALRESGAGAPPVLTAQQRADMERDEALVAQLRGRLSLMDPHAPQTLKGYEILGRAELALGHLPEAAAAWQRVLEVNFDPSLAAQTAELLTETSGSITPAALALFRRALSAAPADAPWRQMAKKRISEAGGS